MNIWPNHTSFSSEEIVSLCEGLFMKAFPQDSHPEEYNYFAALKAEHE